MTKSGSLDGVTRVMAHPQALAQCQAWLTQHYPRLARDAASSNGEAARLASLDPTVAAIAGATAAQAWDLQVVARSEEHTSELQSLMRISYAVFCLKKKKADALKYLIHTY